MKKKTVICLLFALSAALLFSACKKKGAEEPSEQPLVASTSLEATTSLEPVEEVGTPEEEDFKWHKCMDFSIFTDEEIDAINRLSHDGKEAFNRLWWNKDHQKQACRNLLDGMSEKEAFAFEYPNFPDLSFEDADANMTEDDFYYWTYGSEWADYFYSDLGLEDNIDFMTGDTILNNMENTERLGFFYSALALYMYDTYPGYADKFFAFEVIKADTTSPSIGKTVCAVYELEEYIEVYEDAATRIKYNVGDYVGEYTIQYLSNGKYTVTSSVSPEKGEYTRKDFSGERPWALPWDKVYERWHEWYGYEY